MKNILLLTPIFIVFLLVSCRQEENELQKLAILDEELKVGSNAYLEKKEKTSGIVPTDHPLLIMNTFDIKYTWRDYSDFYIQELPQYKNEHYYDNLEWMNIRSILSSPSFYEEAEPDFKERLWQRISERSFVNEPRYALDLLKSLYTNINPTEMANRVNQVVKINEENFKNNSSGWNKHKEAHEVVYDAMNMYLYNRWGLPLFTN